MHLDDLQTFLHVAELGTFSGAARALGVPKSTISRRVTRLEADLGVDLLRRSPRSFALTEDGEVLRDHCRGPMKALAAAEERLEASASEPTGVLTLSCTSDWAASAEFSRMLTRYQRSYPKVRVELQTTNRQVDLVRDGVDLAFRMGGERLPDSDTLMMKRLGRLHGGLFASPCYLQDFGEPKRLEELDGHCLIGLAGERFRSAWQLALTDRPSDQRHFPVTPSLFADDFLVVSSLVTHSAGIAILPGFCAEPGVERGDIQRILPEWSLPGAWLTLLWLRSEQLAPRVRAFVDIATDALSGARWLR